MTEEYRSHPDEAPATAVVRAIADYEDVEPTEIDPPLYEAVDPDALNVLFTDSGHTARGWVEFTYRGYEVFVGSSGRIELTEGESTTHSDSPAQKQH